MKINKIKENGEVFAPATITDAVGFPEMNVSLTKIFNSYNLTALYGGTYSFDTSLTKLDSVLPDAKKVGGVTMGFTNGEGEYEEWTFVGGGYDFTNPLGWFRDDHSTLLELQQAVFPVSVSLSATHSVIEVGKTTDVTFTWGITRKGIDVTEKGATNMFDGVIRSGRTWTKTLTPTAHSSNTFTYSGSYAGMTKSASRTVTYNHRSYYGIVSASTTSISDPTTLSGNTLTSGRSFTWSGINMTYQKTVYSYPTYFGALSDVKDANGFSNLTSYTRSTVRVGDTDYYVYIFTNPTTVAGFKQIYS